MHRNSAQPLTFGFKGNEQKEKGTYMKQHIWIALILALVVGFVGCSSKKGEVDTAKLQKSFANSDQKVNSTVQQAVIAIQSDDYAGAITQLKKVAAEAKLTPEQQQVIKDTLDQLSKKVAESAKGAVNEMQKSMPTAPK